MTVLSQFNDEMASLVDRVKRSLVEVRDGHRGGAAGSVWHPRGLIVTNAHVIGRNRPQVVLPTGQKLDARMLARDRDRDLAALAINTDGLCPIDLGDSDALEAGQLVIALGHPWGVKSAVTAGIVMGSGTDYLQVSYPGSLVAVNLPLRPGNSGGPLVDVAGRLVGINSMMTGPDTGLAIPVNVIKAFLREELGTRDPVPQRPSDSRRGRRPYLTV